MSRNCRFNRLWLSNPLWKDWLEPRTSPNEAFCKLCSKTIMLSNMAVLAIKSHDKGKIHQSITKNELTATLFNFGVTSNKSSNQAIASEELSVQSASTGQVEKQSQGPQHSSSNDDRKSTTMSTYLKGEEITKAEIQWCLFSVNANLSYRVASSSVEAMQVIYPNDQMLQNTRFGRHKMAYTVAYGIAPFFKKELVDSLSSSIVFVACFDESLNKIAQKGQMDVHVRFWCGDTVRTRYLTSEFLGHATAVNLQSAISSALRGLDQEKLLQLSMDGPNVNQKTLKLINEERDHDTKLIDVGTCSLHTIDGALRAADKAEIGVMEFLRCVWQVFKDVPSRRADYRHLAEKNDAKFPLKFCSTRWVENVRPAERAIEIIPHLKSYVSGVQTQNFREPDSKSYLIMKGMLSDPLLIVRLHFFVSVAKELEIFLVRFQTDKPMLPFLYQALESLMGTLLQRFVKDSVFTENMSGSKMLKVSLKEDNLLDEKSVDIGFAAKAALKSLKKEVCQQRKFNFLSQCRSFLVKLVTKLQERNPMKYDLVLGSACLDPDVMLHDEVAIKLRLISKALEILVENNRMTGTEADRAKSYYQSLCSRPSAQTVLKKFHQADRLDDFLMDLCRSQQSNDEFLKFVRIILCLSHGQASVERGFSINKSLLVENLLEQSLIAQRIVKDHLRANYDGSFSKVEITKPLILSARNAASRYKEAKKLEDSKRVVEEGESRERKRKAIELKEKEAERKRLRLQLLELEKDITYLQK